MLPAMSYVKSDGTIGEWPQRRPEFRIGPERVHAESEWLFEGRESGGDLRFTVDDGERDTFHLAAEGDEGDIPLSRAQVLLLINVLSEWHERTGTCTAGHYNADAYVVDGGTCKYCCAPFPT